MGRVVKIREKKLKWFLLTIYILKRVKCLRIFRFLLEKLEAFKHEPLFLCCFLFERVVGNGSILRYYELHAIS